MTGFLSNHEAEICLPVLPLSSRCMSESLGHEKEPRMRGSCVAGVGALASAPGANGGRRCSDHLANLFRQP